MSKNSLVEDATRVWKMLDEMALNDPVGYRNFIDKQLKAGRKCVAPPEVRFVIKAKLKKSGRKLYVNYCEWNAVPEAKTESSPIVVKCGETFDLDENLGITLAFNPNVFVQHGFGSLSENFQSSEENKSSDRYEEANRYQLIWLGLHYLEQEKQLSTVESNSVICTAAPLRPKILAPSAQFGSRDAILKSIGFQKYLLHTQRTHSPTKENQNMEHIIQGVLKDLVPENIGNSLPVDEMDDRGEESLFTRSEPFILPQRVKIGKQTMLKPLIEELGPRPQLAEVTKSKGIDEVPIQWQAEVVVVANKERIPGNSNQLKLVFNLPGVRSGSQCDLDITEDKLLLIVADSPVSYKPLEITLPCKVDASNAEAKFSTRKKCLTLIVPIMSSST